MLGCLIVLVLMEMMYLVASILYLRFPILEFGMSIVLGVVYGTVCIAYFPLFFTLVTRLQRAFPTMYQKLRRKVLYLLLLFIVLIVFRYSVYLILMFAQRQLKYARTYLPFYVSELVITSAYIKVLTEIYHVDQE
jgi:hypothetical protein